MTVSSGGGVGHRRARVMRSRSDCVSTGSVRRVSAGSVRREPGLGAASARGEDVRLRIRTGDHTLVRVNGGVESDADGDPGA